MDPQDIRYVEDSMSTRFSVRPQNRRHYESTAEWHSFSRPDSHHPCVFLEDSRLLWAFKKIGLKRVPVKHVDMHSVDDRKFSMSPRLMVASLSECVKSSCFVQPFSHNRHAVLLHMKEAQACPHTLVGDDLPSNPCLPLMELPAVALEGPVI